LYHKLFIYALESFFIEKVFGVVEKVQLGWQFDYHSIEQVKRK